MKRLLLILFVLTSIVNLAEAKEIHLKVVETSDAHGNFFPVNFTTRQPGRGSFARVANYVNSLRGNLGDDKVVLLDAGDILQGQPAVYYYNFVDTTSTHVAADVMNYMRFDAVAVGNHDIEAGHDVYDRWTRQCNFPVLGANVINTKTGRPYFTPYTIIERQGLKIAVIGMVTPSIPSWVPESLWSGMKFDDIQRSAEYWVNLVRNTEKPDIVIGLFHSGLEDRYPSKYVTENASAAVAQSVAGFDLILMGHDHQRHCAYHSAPDGTKVLVMNPAANAFAVAEADLKINVEAGKVTAKEITGRIVDMADFVPDPNYSNHFADNVDTINQFVGKRLGVIDKTISTDDAYFGSSAFIDFIHTIQLEAANADISFAAPLSFDTSIREGEIFMSDLFSLYRYENRLYTMELSGKEIKDYLEYSYYLWTKTMSSPGDNLIWFKNEDPSTHFFQNSFYNFDSAAGIIYTVDVTRPKGEKVNIISMADGKRFDLTRIYRVAVNSYRGNGGGGHLTDGAGIWRSMLKRRVVKASERDIRYYIMKYIESRDTISPRPLDQWRFVPEDIVTPAIVRNRADLFGTKK
ncbi:MAG: 5'-nucleotidase C-terminal domain-containing protein [Muribaculaceae bacterium]|nr:5'-nucleotidase C-terminal domain-containing protein [Muribaculaceae bacterium]